MLVTSLNIYIIRLFIYNLSSLVSVKQKQFYVGDNERSYEEVAHFFSDTFPDGSLMSKSTAVQMLPAF